MSRDLWGPALVVLTTVIALVAFVVLSSRERRKYYDQMRTRARRP